MTAVAKESEAQGERMTKEHEGPCGWWAARNHPVGRDDVMRKNWQCEAQYAAYVRQLHPSTGKFLEGEGET